MILVLEDDGCLHVYPRIADVAQAIEPLDADAVLRAVFDESGTRYEIRWLEENGASRALGLTSVVNGRYDLRPVGRDVEALRAVIRGAAAIVPASAEATVRALVR